MNKKPVALVVYGDGINCEDETAYALTLAGFESQKVHCVELLEAPARLASSQMLALPGGFSFGDEIVSGRVLAIKLKEKLQEVLHRYVDKGNLVLGICNGFQILVQLGLLPDSKQGAPRAVSLRPNQDGKFINKWVALDVTPGVRFFERLSSIHLPIRHGEGRLTLPTDISEELELVVKEQAPLRYSIDVNGSFDRIAALANKAGNVLGLMPHPEAFVRWSQHPAWTAQRYGLKGKGEPGFPVEGYGSSGGATHGIAPTADRGAVGAGSGAVGAGCGTPHGLQILKNAAAMLS